MRCAKYIFVCRLLLCNVLQLIFSSERRRVRESCCFESSLELSFISYSAFECICISQTFSWNSCSAPNNASNNCFSPKNICNKMTNNLFLIKIPIISLAQTFSDEINYFNHIVSLFKGSRFSRLENCYSAATRHHQSTSFRNEFQSSICNDQVIWIESQNNNLFKVGQMINKTNVFSISLAFLGRFQNMAIDGLQW